MVKHEDEKRPRPKYNNQNPNNKLRLNKFHQIDASDGHSAESHRLYKRRRDILRLSAHLNSKGLQVDPALEVELKDIEVKIENKKKTFEKERKRDFFISQKYQQLMTIERRKVLRKLHEAREGGLSTHELEDKLNYIKHYPKHLKYVALFPNKGQLSDKALEFQQSIMKDIKEKLAKETNKKNKVLNINKNTKKKQKTDDFFLQEQEEEE